MILFTLTSLVVLLVRAGLAGFEQRANYYKYSNLLKDEQLLLLLQEGENVGESLYKMDLPEFFYLCSFKLTAIPRSF